MNVKEIIDCIKGELEKALKENLFEKAEYEQPPSYHDFQKMKDDGRIKDFKITEDGDVFVYPITPVDFIYIPIAVVTGKGVFEKLVEVENGEEGT
jgi:hypothetical protein